MIRVLYVLPEFTGETATAAQVRAHALLPRLARRTDLTVLTFTGPGEPEVAQADFPIRTVARRPMSPLELTLATFAPGPRAFRRLTTTAARERLAGLIAELRPDIVHLDSFGTFGLLGTAVSAAHRAGIVAHSHDAQSLRYQRFARAGSLPDRAQSYAEYRKILSFEQRRLRDADVTLVDSPEDCTYLARWLGDRAAVLPLGFDPRSYAPDGPRARLEPLSVVYSGSMKARQSEDAAEFLVRDVMPRVWSSFPACHLYIVGSEPSRGVQALATDRVHVTGFVEDLASYLRAATVYVCPLRLGSGMRTRVIEALACGAVTVATELSVRGLAPSDEPRDPWMVDDTAAGIAARIVETLGGGHSGLSAQAASYARSRYSWDAVGDQLYGIYAALTARRAGGAGLGGATGTAADRGT